MDAPLQAAIAARSANVFRFRLPPTENSSWFFFLPRNPKYNLAAAVISALGFLYSVSMSEAPFALPARA